MAATSALAWEALIHLFEGLRNEEDHGHLNRADMHKVTGVITDDVSAAEKQTMIAAKKIDRSHQSCKPMELRVALNKIAHHNIADTTFRVDGRGAHYLVLGGTFYNKHWVAEVLVSELHRNAAAAARALR